MACSDSGQVRLIGKTGEVEWSSSFHASEGAAVLAEKIVGALGKRPRAVPESMWDSLDDNIQQELKACYATCIDKYGQGSPQIARHFMDQLKELTEADCDVLLKWLEKHKNVPAQGKMNSNNVAPANGRDAKVCTVC